LGVLAFSALKRLIRASADQALSVLTGLIGEKNKFLNSGPQFVEGLLQVLHGRAAGRSSVLILGDLQLFAQDHRFLGRADANLCALLRNGKQLDFNFVANENALARTPPED
jgi:hypothetical protein